MRFYIVRAATAEGEPLTDACIHVALSLTAARDLGQDLFGHPPYAIDSVDLDVTPTTIAKLIERMSSAGVNCTDRLIGATVIRQYPQTIGTKRARAHSQASQ